jgi:DNA replication protein DnaC
MELKQQLAGQARQLRLSGVLETLETRHRQAIEGQWSYIEFLTRLFEDEIERRAQKQLHLRLRRATLNCSTTIRITHRRQLEIPTRSSGQSG